MFNNFKIDTPASNTSIIKVLGVGGGGCNAVSYMYRQGIAGVDFIVTNTDGQVLEKSPVPAKLQLGRYLTQGLGAGSLPDVGRAAAEESLEELLELIDVQNTKMLFVTAGMGGGTGTGAAPVIAKAAKASGILTVGIVTTPFSFEGPMRMKYADEGVNEMKDAVDALLVISNDKLTKLYSGFSLRNAFAKADDVLTTAAKGIAEIITINGLQNVDMNDVKTAMSNSGKAMMGTGVSKGDDRAKRAAESALYSPLLDDNSIKGAKWILVNISAGEEDVLLDEYSEINNYFQNLAGNSAHLKCGYCYNPELGDAISVTLIATGFETEHIKLNTTTEENTIKEPVAEIIETPAAEAPVAEEPLQEIRHKLEHGEEISNERHADTREEVLVHTLATPEIPQKSMKELMREMELLRTLSDKIKTTDGLKEIENTPAYLRNHVNAENTRPSDKANISRLTLSVDNEEKKIEIRENNSYVHDQVD